MKPVRARRPGARRLGRRDFNMPALRVARDLLGIHVVRNVGNRLISAMIVDVEAYLGPRDRASYAYAGRRTPRLEPLYGDGGTVFVNLVYGMHWMLNFSVAGAGRPESVLIRGVMGEVGKERRLVQGPGRVASFLEVDHGLDGHDATTSTDIWLEDRGVRIPTASVRRGPRVGVSYAGPHWAARKLRFWLEYAERLPRRNVR